MSKITASARGESCTVRLPFVCNHDDSTVVFAHIPGVRFGHGVGYKTLIGAYACHECHSVLDGRVKRPAGMTQDDLKLCHYEAVLETLLKLVDKGLVDFK